MDPNLLVPGSSRHEQISVTIVVMQSEDRTAILGIVIGLAWGALTMAGPLAFPGAPIWVWQLSFMVAVVVVVGGIISLVYDLKVRPRLIGQPKLDPFLFTATTAFAVGIVALAIFIVRGPQSSGNQAGKEVGHVAQPEPQIVTSVRLSTRKPDGNGLTPLLEGHADIASASSRLRIFVDYSLYPYENDQWSPPVRIPIAIIKESFRGQQIHFPILFRFPYQDQLTQEVRWSPGWGNPQQPLSRDNPFMPSFKSRTRLVFETPDGKEQHYSFTIAKPPKDDLGVELQVITDADAWH